MPAVITRGAFSAQGFGFGASAAGCGPDGTVGIFALGDLTTNRNKYTYASCTSTICGVGAASIGSRSGAAAGNSTRGIFALGATASCGLGTNIRNKYTYATCSSTTSCVATSSGNSGFGSASGNSTRGIFALGYSGGASNVRNKYTYASCTSTATGVATASAASFRLSSAGNSTRGIFALGLIAGSCPSTTRNKYTYACCTSTASGVGAASVASYCGDAAGNGTRGIFALGAAPCRSTIRNKYTYATCVSTACGVGASSVASYAGAATGNSTRGIFALGSTPTCIGGSTIRNKYTYASCTSTATGVAASSTRTYDGAAASWATGVNS